MEYSEINNNLFKEDKKKIEFLYKLIKHPHVHNGTIYFMRKTEGCGDAYDNKTNFEEIYDNWQKQNKPYLMATLSVDISNKSKITIFENRLFIEATNKVKNKISKGGFNVSIQFEGEELIDYFYQIINEINI